MSMKLKISVLMFGKIEILLAELTPLDRARQARSSNGVRFYNQKNSPFLGEFDFGKSP